MQRLHTERRKMNYSEYCKEHGFDENSLTRAEVFRKGQATVIAWFADLPGVSLAFEPPAKTIERLLKTETIAKYYSEENEK